MANHLDLEEQEQLDRIKHFWSSWGNLITIVLALVVGGFSAWNFYNYWKNRQSFQAAALLEVIDYSIANKDFVRADEVFLDIRNKYPKTIQSIQAGFLVAKYSYDNKNDENAKSALTWIIENGSDIGYKAIANLRFINILIEQKKYEEAFILISNAFPFEFDALMDDRKGDINFLQEKNKNAILNYLNSYQKIDKNIDYKKLLEFKLNSLGLASSLIVKNDSASLAEVKQ